MFHLYILDLTDTDSLSVNYEYFVQRLKPELALQVYSKKAEKLKYHCLGSKLLQQYAISDAIGDKNWRKVDITAGAHGKPTSVQTKFNTSHDQNMALVAVTGQQDVGLDVTSLDPEFLDFDFLTMIFTPVEISRIQQYNSLMSVYWAIKESFCKYHGIGLLKNELTDIEILLPALFENVLRECVASHTKGIRWIQHPKIEIMLKGVSQQHLYIRIFVLDSLVGAITTPVSATFTIHLLEVNHMIALLKENENLL